MTAPQIHMEATAVVLRGSFNPRIFEPLWLSKNGLVAEREAAKAEVQLIDRDYCHLNLGWIELVILEDRLQARTTSETVNDGQVRDLLVGALHLLPHTPVEVGSIHHRSEIAVSTEEQWHAVGHTLAPKELWQGVLDEPGMFDFAMMGRRPDDFQGAIKVRIQPSRVVEPGVFMNVNDEFHMPDKSSSVSNTAEILEKLWPEAESRARGIRTKLIERLVS